MSEEILRPLQEIARLEVTLQKPLLDAGIPILPTPIQVLASMLPKPEEVAEEEIPEEIVEGERAFREWFVSADESAKRIVRVGGMRVKYG